MKFTLSWLKEHLDTDADLATIDKTLTAIGLEVEGITDASAELSVFTVAQILSAERHPDADKLQICKVKSDEGELQIVCGAPNARAGIKVALAKEGALIPNGGFKIKKSKIRGVESCGMLCSARELNLGEDHAGIMELPEDATIGQPIAAVLGLNDPVIEIAITPNRGDCLGVYGIARDLAAAGVGTLKPLNIPNINASGASPVSIAINTPHCAQFIGCAIKGVQNGASPEWLQQLLVAIGLRPISVLVDITNYFTFTYGRPLHVYDMAKLNGNITVRDGIEGEAFDALNDKSYTLKGGECVIADDAGVLGLGGVVGGVPSGVTQDTTDVFLECAWFDPVHIANVGRTHDAITDARYRFERTVDPDFVQSGVILAMQMIIDLCGGTASDLVVAGEAPDWKREIAFDSAFINQLGGIELSAEKQINILTSLGFTVKGASATPPSWRPDIEGKADLAEEVLRIYGYDNVPSVPMPKLANISQGALDESQKRNMTARRLLATRGLYETRTWAFMSDNKAKLFGFNNADLVLANPISADLNVMRPSLLPNLIEALVRNAARKMQSLGLFELGPQFAGTAPKEQAQVACVVRAGKANDKEWSRDARNADAYDAKADALAVLQAAGVQTDKLQVMTDTPNWYHPGRSGKLCLGPKNVLAYFGELHPATLQDLDCEFPVVACEVFLDAIPQSKAKANTALKTSDYQPVDRDFAFIIDEDTPAGDVIRLVQSAEKDLVQDVTLFDVYQGKCVEDGKKSLALTIRLQAMDRTLKDDEIEAVSKKVIEAAAKAGAALRA